MMSSISMDVHGPWPKCMQDRVCLYLQSQRRGTLECYCDDHLFLPFVSRQIVVVNFYSDWTDDGIGFRQAGLLSSYLLDW